LPSLASQTAKHFYNDNFGRQTICEEMCKEEDEEKKKKL
jgi:hypothetical protein